ncbi:MAG: glucuronate isomerase [Oscillospiraceae bacterium]|nr:glucuronate isomerase [Oscillospiraceae bacterium]
MLGQAVEDGRFPADLELLGGIIGDICYHNAKRLFE